MLFEPGAGASIAGVEEVGAGASIADNDGGFVGDFIERDDGAPEFFVWASGSDVTGMAVDAAFGEVDLSTANEGGIRRG